MTQREKTGQNVLDDSDVGQLEREQLQRSEVHFYRHQPKRKKKLIQSVTPRLKLSTYGGCDCLGFHIHLQHAQLGFIPGNLIKYISQKGNDRKLRKKMHL